MDQCPPSLPFSEFLMRAGADLRIREGQRILPLEHCAHGAGKRDFKAVEYPYDAERDDDQPVPATPGQTVQPRRNVSRIE